MNLSGLKFQQYWGYSLVKTIACTVDFIGRAVKCVKAYFARSPPPRRNIDMSLELSKSGKKEERIPRNIFSSPAEDSLV